MRLTFAMTIGLLFSLPLTGAPAGPESAHRPQAPGRSTHGALWEFLFDDDITPEEYAKQLDYFKIEIAAVAKNGKTQYVSKFSQYKPDKRQGSERGDYRFQATWKKGALHAADRKLLAKAGINADGKELLHFFPEAAASQLSELEQSYADRKPGEIRRTRFAIQPKKNGQGYEFVVVEQDPPKPGAEANAAQGRKPSGN